MAPSRNAAIQKIRIVLAQDAYAVALHDAIGLQQSPEAAAACVELRIAKRQSLRMQGRALTSRT
jgi:hypothetical protein